MTHNRNLHHTDCDTYQSWLAMQGPYPDPTTDHIYDCSCGCEDAVTNDPADLNEYHEVPRIRFRAVQDDGSGMDDDPRTWSGEPWSTVIYRTSNRHDTDSHEHKFEPEIEVFTRMLVRTEDETLALRAAQHYAGVYGTGNTVTIHTIHGYTQSDWWDVVTTDKGDAEVLAQYLRGDVWVVFEEHGTVCEHGDLHWEIVNSLGGVYADSEEEAINYAKEDW